MPRTIRAVGAAVQFALVLAAAFVLPATAYATDTAAPIETLADRQVDEPDPETHQVREWKQHDPVTRATRTLKCLDALGGLYHRLMK